jgi:hypothetical protein
MKPRPLLAAGVVAGALLAVLCGAGLQRAAAGRAVRAEAAQQEPEIRQCRERLSALHAVWSAYRRDHRGADPPSIASLMPAYLKEPRWLVCPTAVRVRQKGLVCRQGTFRCGRRQYRQTYGLRWLAGGYAKVTRDQRGAAPLITCTAHREAMYYAVHGRALPASAPEGGVGVPAPLLVARRSGAVEAVSAAE